MCVCKRDTTLIYLLVRSLVRSNELIKKLLRYVDKNVSQFLFTRARDKIPALSKKLSTSTFVSSLCIIILEQACESDRLKKFISFSFFCIHGTAGPGDSPATLSLLSSQRRIAIEMVGQPMAVCHRAQMQRRAASAARGASRSASSSFPTSPAAIHRSPLLVHSPPLPMTPWSLLRWKGESNLLTPTAERNAAVFDLPIAASGFSATTVPHAAVAATFTTTTDTSDDDIDQSPVENVPKKYVC